VICILHDLKILIFKRKKRKKESIITRRRGWLQRSNAIKESLVRWVCVYGGISLQP
jgi:hypothetical protein